MKKDDLSNAVARLNGLSIFSPDSHVEHVSNSGTSEGVQKAWETRKGGLQHFSKWNTYGGGMGANDKRSYDIHTGEGHPDNEPGTFGKNHTQYSITPIKTGSGRHVGYSARVFPSSRFGHAWLDSEGKENYNGATLGVMHRSPHEAWAAAAKHYDVTKAAPKT